MISILKIFSKRKSLPKGNKEFSESIYMRHSPDIQLALGRSEITSGYEHYTRYGAVEGRPRTYRRLGPGQSTTFEIPLPEKALTGLKLFIGVEQATGSDNFDLELIDNEETIFRTRLPYGTIVLDGSTYIPTGSITGLGERIQARLSIPKTVQNEIWLMTKQGLDGTIAPFEGMAFFDDPVKINTGPVAINLSPVSQCNQNCPHCISKFTRKSFSRLSDEAQHEIRMMASAGKIHHISVDYSGDPFFTNARYFPLFDFIDELGCQFRIDTNGAYIDEQVMRRVAQGRLYGINFSLDATTDQTHSRVRPGKIPLDKILDNIRLAIAILEECGRTDVLTSANFSIMRSNVHEAIDFVDLCRSLGLKSVNFSQVHIYQNETTSESLSNSPEIYNNIRDELLERLLLSGLIFSVPPPYLPGLETHGRMRCTAPWESAVILSNGDVQACCVPGTKIGNLHQNSFEEIWSSKEAQSFRQQAVSPQSAICGACAFFKHRGIGMDERSE